MIGRTADSLVTALALDVWPSIGAVIDYGITNATIYAAYQTAVRYRGVTADQLHATNCNGQQLSALIGIPIHTGWDDLAGLEDGNDTASAPTG